MTTRLPPEFTKQFPRGIAIAFSAIPVIKNLEEPLRSEVQAAFGESIRYIWFSTTAVAAIGFVSSILMKSIPLNSNLDEQWGLEETGRGHDDNSDHDVA